MGTTGIASVVVSFLLSVLTLFNGLPIGNISNNAAHWDKEQISADARSILRASVSLDDPAEWLEKIK